MYLCNCFTEVRGGKVMGLGDNFSVLTIVQFLFAPSQLSGVSRGEIEQMKQYLRFKIAVEIGIFL